MKKIISGIELQEKMKENINLLCDTVKTTLGPIGHNVIIDSSFCAPFITNDGVTIAENIESDDPIANAILNIAKEASIKTNETVGDGTTSSLVLLQCLFNNGLTMRESTNSIQLKKEMEESLKEIIPKLKSMSWKAEKKDYIKIASISSGEEEIGNMVSNLFLKMNQKGSIKIREGNKTYTYSEIIDGYVLDSGVTSDYFLKNKKEVVLRNSFILILKGYLNELEEIAEIINGVNETKSDLLIIGTEYSEEVINELVLQNYQNENLMILVSAPDFASRKHEILEDVAVFTKARIIDFNLKEKASFCDLGNCNEIKISSNETMIISSHKDSNQIKNKIKEIKERMLKTDETYEIEYLKERMAKLKNGIGMIYVGAQTKTERREKKMRFDDCLCALESCDNGVLPGEGISLLALKHILKSETSGAKLIQKALEEPTKQIIENMGLNSKEVLKKLKETNFQTVYNFETNSYESIKETKIIDPFDVVINTLKNAISIASMLLTTSHLIINEKNKNEIENQEI